MTSEDEAQVTYQLLCIVERERARERERERERERDVRDKKLSGPQDRLPNAVWEGGNWEGEGEEGETEGEEKDQVGLKRKVSYTLFPKPNTRRKKKKNLSGLVRDSNPGPLAPKARIMPLDQQANLQEQSHTMLMRRIK